MPEKQYGQTRGNILRAAAQLFSENGYNKVTTREIAMKAGINVASMYYYFPAKADILKNLYEFYSKELQKALPDLDELLRLAETLPPQEALMKAEFHFDESVRGFLDQILVTAAREICADPESEQFIRENIFAPSINILRPLLERMMELGRIKPCNIEAFLSVFTYYGYSAAALSNSPFGKNPESYISDLSLLFSIITPEPKNLT